MNNNTYNPLLADPCPFVSYDPFSLNPSKALLTQCLKNFKYQCYEIIRQKQELKKENEATQAICLPFYEQRHEQLIKLIKLYEFRIRIAGKKNRQVSNGISQEDIERARQYPVRDLYTGKTRQFGRRLVGKCPFHPDDKPSFVIYEDNRGFHCFGCGANGNSITFVMKKNNLNFIEAVKYLIK